MISYENNRQKWLDGFVELKAHPEYNGKLPKKDADNKTPSWMKGKFTDASGTNNMLGGWSPDSVKQFAAHTMALIDHRKKNMPAIQEMEKAMLQGIQNKHGIKLTAAGERPKKRRRRSTARVQEAKTKLAAINLTFGEV